MARFVTVTLNPALDKTLAIERLRPGGVHRAQIVALEGAGKGVNVALTLRALGAHPVEAGGLLGREGAAHVLDRLRAAQIETAFTLVDGAVRTNITLIEQGTGITTKINEPGLPASSADLASVLAWADSAQPGDLWALCGSLPPGLPDTAYRDLIARLHARGALTFLDTSGWPLRHALEARPYAIKVNREEAAFALDETLPGRVSLRDEAAVRLRERSGAALAAITYGPLGVTLAARDQVWGAAAPTIPVRSTVGAGDAALAGLLDGVARGQPPDILARWMTACGSAAAAHPRSSLDDAEQVRALFAATEALRLDR
ncbi:MAG: 1-phosphofructokinase family hexose kinase [Candidatus Flexifilum sp.]